MEDEAKLAEMEAKAREQEALMKKVDEQEASIHVPTQQTEEEKLEIPDHEPS